MPKTILLADDSLAVHRAVEKSLAGRGVEIAAAASGDEALESFAERQPDMALIDVHMPGSSGYEVSRQIKAAAPHVAVILLVGTFEPYDEDRARQSGADGHLMKPFDEVALRARVDEMIGIDEKIEEPGSEAVDAPQPAATESEAETAPAAIAVAAPEEVVVAVDPGETPGEPQNGLSESDIDRIVERVVERLSIAVVERLAREILPEVAETVVRQRIDELEREAD